LSILFPTPISTSFPTSFPIVNTIPTKLTGFQKVSCFVTYYTGIQGDVTIDANGDREFNYMMKQIHDSSNQSQVRYCSLYKRNQWKPCSAILNYICQMSHWVLHTGHCKLFWDI